MISLITMMFMEIPPPTSPPSSSNKKSNIISYVFSWVLNILEPFITRIEKNKIIIENRMMKILENKQTELGLYPSLEDCKILIEEEDKRVALTTEMLLSFYEKEFQVYCREEILEFLTYGVPLYTEEYCCVFDNFVNVSN